MRKICVITGARAEFGLMQNMLSALRSACDVQLQLIVTGTHLVDHYGNTIDEIRSAGFLIDAEVDMLLASDSPRAVGCSMGLGVIGLTNSLTALNPDIVVLLGDRYEVLAAAQSAMILRIPIAHIHGGEATEGVIDEAIRHAVTKMSHIHFTAAEPFRQKVIQMGEAPQSVYNVGALGLDNVENLKPASLDELQDYLDISLDAPIFLVTYHPLSLDANGASSVVRLLDALASQTGVKIVFTGANADPFGQKINSYIKAFCSERPGQAVFTASLGVRRYLSLMSMSDVVIGNSSSGLIEAPYLGVPTVNIGHRQQGRLRAPSVLDSMDSTKDILRAIEKARSEKWQKLASRRRTPYGTPGAASKIVSVLRKVKLDGILLKSFYGG